MADDMKTFIREQDEEDKGMEPEARSLLQERFGPLQGVRILSTGTIIAQPFAADLAAEMGAEVIQIERPGVGDAVWRNLEFPISGIGSTSTEVAYGVLFLAPDESPFMTGSELIIDGGFTAQ